MCRDSGPKWKRELVQDHKFDFVDVDEFYDDSCFTRTKYSLSTLLIIKSVLVYMADLWTAISLLVIGKMTITPVISIEIAKWIFLGCIVMSFLLLFLDIRKSRLIIESRDISYAFTSVIASRYYTTKSYPHYCFFQKINDSKKTTDEFAFFVFFTLKGWKRLLLAEAPRQVVNAVTLYAIGVKEFSKGLNVSVQSGIDSLGANDMQRVMTGTMLFSFVVFLVSFVMVCIASIMYIPLLCHIRGNLKEYCCHKIDKRISEILKKQAQKRRKGLNQKGAGASKQNDPMQAIQPTLPNVEMFDEEKRPISAMYGPADFALPQMMADRGMAMSPVPLYNPPRAPGRRGSGSSFVTDMSGYTNSHSLGPKRSYGNLNTAQDGMMDPSTMPGYGGYVDPSVPPAPYYQNQPPYGHTNQDEYTSEYSGDGYQSDYSSAPLRHRDSDQSAASSARPDSDAYQQPYGRGPTVYESPRPLPRGVPGSDYGESPRPLPRGIPAPAGDYGESPRPLPRGIPGAGEYPSRPGTPSSNYASPIIERRVVQQTNVMPSRYQDQPARQARGPYQGQNQQW